MNFQLIDVKCLKSEEIEAEDLEIWKDEIERRMDWIEQIGQLLIPLVVYQDGFDDDYNPLFEVQFSDYNLINFLAIHQLYQQQPRKFEMVNAWLVADAEVAEKCSDCIEEFSFTVYDN